MTPGVGASGISVCSTVAGSVATKGYPSQCSNLYRYRPASSRLKRSVRGLLEESVSAILVQVKNSPVFAADIKSSCFADDSEPLPIVRMVFALASEESAVGIPPAAERGSSSPSSFTAYDIWCAGLTEETFGVMQNDTERMHAQALLQAMLHQGGAAWMYTHEVGKSVARGMQPLVSTEKDHWCGWAEL